MSSTRARGQARVFADASPARGDDQRLVEHAVVLALEYQHLLADLSPRAPTGSPRVRLARRKRQLPFRQAQPLGEQLRHHQRILVRQKELSPRAKPPIHRLDDRRRCKTTKRTRVGQIHVQITVPVHVAKPGATPPSTYTHRMLVKASPSRPSAPRPASAAGATPIAAERGSESSNAQAHGGTTPPPCPRPPPRSGFQSCEQCPPTPRRWRQGIP